MKKALFWDFDGTLAFSKSLWTGSVHKALELCSKENRITCDEIRPYMQTGFTWHSPDADYRHLTKGNCWWEHMNRRFSFIYQALGTGKQLADKVSSKVRELVLDVKNYSLYNDSIMVLEACRKAGFSNYIVSNNYPELTEVIFQLGLSPYFAGYIISALVGYEKPRREIFETALQIAGYPDICYMIGDNPAADIAGAKEAGIKAILVHKNDECAADYVCTNLTDLLDVLGIC